MYIYKLYKIYRNVTDYIVQHLFGETLSSSIT